MQGPRRAPSQGAVGITVEAEGLVTKEGKVKGVIARAWVLTSAAGIVTMGIQTGKGFVSPQPQPPNLPCGISTPRPLTGL